MASGLADFDTPLAARIQDAAARLSTAQMDVAMGSARAEYEAAYPRQRAVKLTGAGSFDFSITSITFPGYVDGFSVVNGVVYPYVAANQILEGLRDEDWRVLLLDTGLVLRLLAGSPSASEYVLVHYTSQHTLTRGVGASSTVPAAHDEALADLGAKHCCLALANLASQEVDSSVASDTMDRLSKSEHYRSQATRWQKEFDRKMGELDSARKASFVVQHFTPTSSGNPRRPALFHG